MITFEIIPLASLPAGVSSFDLNAWRATICVPLAAQGRAFLQGVDLAKLAKNRDGFSELVIGGAYDADRRPVNISQRIDIRIAAALDVGYILLEFHSGAK